VIPTLRQLRYFTRIVELGSMTKAAEHLNVAQTALGSQIQLLEEEMGIALLARHSRGVVPTKAGELLFRRAQDILALVSQCAREIADFRAERSEMLTIGASASVLRITASYLLAQASLLLPNVTVSLVEDTSVSLLKALKRGELDLIVAHELPPTDGLRRVPWLRENLLFVTAARKRGRGTAGAELGTISLEKALQTELTLPVRLDGIRKIIESAAEPLNLKYRVTYSVQSHEALKILIAEKSVASVLPYGLVASELNSGTLFAQRIISPILTRRLYAVRSSRRLSTGDEVALENLLLSIKTHLIATLGPLATPLGSKEELA
jgi:LysR family nitrogen assimilation transcriptional regulator